MANDENAGPASDPAPNDAKSAPATFDVGYGRPPRHTRFKKGQSGNPKGRPKGSKNLSTYIDQELKQKITIVENGVRKRVNKNQAIAKQVVNKAAGGDPKMVPLLLSREQSASEHGGGIGPADAPMAREDEQVLEALVGRIRGSEPPARPGSSPHSAAPSTGPSDTAANPTDDAKGSAGHDQ